MPPTSQDPAPVRPAEVVNEEIRQLVTSVGGWLYGETRQRYEVLRLEWAIADAAEKRDVVEAA